MAEDASQQASRSRVSLVYASQAIRPKPVPVVSFDRRELATILNLYGRMVGQGIWRDYAMDFLRERALFSIYRRNSEHPLYVIEKNPKLRHRQGQYSVASMDGRNLKRGHDLDAVLKVLEPKPRLVT